jgi:hypothetical protein
VTGYVLITQPDMTPLTAQAYWALPPQQRELYKPVDGEQRSRRRLLDELTEISEQLPGGYR